MLNARSSLRDYLSASVGGQTPAHDTEVAKQINDPQQLLPLPPVVQSDPGRTTHGLAPRGGELPPSCTAAEELAPKIHHMHIFGTQSECCHSVSRCAV